MDRNCFDFWRFHTLDELKEAIAELGLSIPVSTDMSLLAKEKVVGGQKLKNSLVIHPLEAADGLESGAPSQTTMERYEKFAASGVAMIWMEAVAVSADGRSSNHELYLSKETFAGFKELCDRIHAKGKDIKIIIQLTHSGRFSLSPKLVHNSKMLDERLGLPEGLPLLSDDELDKIADDFIVAARLAKEAGFDGIDIKTCHQYLLSEALSAYDRPGRYGGSYENRTALFRNIVRDTAKEVGSGMILSTRTALYDHMPYPYGFGTKEGENGAFCPDEGIRLLKDIKELGVTLISSSVGCHYVDNGINHPFNYDTGLNEHPLVTLERLIKVTETFKKAMPELTFVSAGMSYLQHLAPFVSAGVVESGISDLAGFGRLALANPHFVEDIMNGTLSPRNACIACGQCLTILAAGHTAGCPVRDPEHYRAVLQEVLNGKK